MAAPSTEVRVDAVLDHDGSERRAGDDRLADDAMLPADQLAVLVQRRFQPVEVQRAIEPAANVIFARPLQLDRDAVGAERLGDRDRLDDVVGAHVGAPAEAAAGEQRVDLHLLRLEPRGRRRVGLIDGLELVAAPDLATVGVEFHDRIERLHRRVRQIGKLVGRGNQLGGPLERRSRVALLAGRLAGLFGEPAVFRHDGGGAALPPCHPTRP